MVLRRWYILFLCAALVWPIDCAPVAKKDESKAADETIAEIKKEKEKRDQTDKQKEKESAAVAEKAQTSRSESAGKTTLMDDWKGLPHNLKEDIVGLWSKENLACNLIALGGAGALAVVSVNKWDHPIAEHHREYGALGNWERLGYEVGKPEVHLGVMGAFYAYAKLSDNPESLETSKRLAEALILSGVTTLALKEAVGRKRPTGHGFAFPSGHASSSFATAAVLDGMYGPLVGIPLYLVSSFVAFSRVDAKEHYLSDVIFGAALGYVFGRTVTKTHERQILGFEVAPWVDPDVDGAGIMLQRRF